MKRIVLFVLILIFASLFCFADITEQYLFDHAAGSLPVYGHMDTYWVLTVDRISHGGGTVGMDFDLLGDDIIYNADTSLGRLIAYWTFIVNLESPWRLRVHASPLAPEEGGDTRVNYYLTFNIDFPGDNGLTVSTDWTLLSSENANDYSVFPYSDGTYSEAEVFSSVKHIRFMLDQYTDEQRYLWDDGRYTATVSLILETS
ncbi:MAG: hypothetical protein ILP16_08625 [Spirochaetales bacterium]|nr:hypothetical protein [Spirochaetales bacterium]